MLWLQKINAKNAWNLKVIDYMKSWVHNKGNEERNMVKNATALDVCSKVYVCRVETVQSEGMKIASTFMQMNVQKENDDENNGEFSHNALFVVFIECFPSSR